MNDPSEGQAVASALQDAFFRQLFEHCGVAMVAVDTSLNIRAWNSAASRIFGADGARMIGTPATSVIPQKQRPAAERLLRQAIERGQVGDIEFQYRDEKGLERELIVTISPVRLSAGVIAGASACVRDITRRIKLQTERDQNLKMVSLGEMAGAMAHYFNNILGGVMTSADFAVNSGDPLLQGRILQQVVNSLGRASNLLEGLLCFAEGDQRGSDLSDYSEIVNCLADELEPRLKAKNINLTLNLPRLPIIPMPRKQLRTVLNNILQNATEAMGDGGDLSLASELSGHEIITRISDTGCGISPETQSRIFEPFYSTKNPLSGGSSKAPGLGLAVAHGIVQVLGGTISLTSHPDRGSCFIVTLPIPRDETVIDSGGQE